MRIGSCSRLLLTGLALIAAAGLVRAHPGLDTQIADLTARIAAQPEDARLFLQRGELHRLHRDWGAARSDLERARRLDPELSSVDFSLGRLSLEAGDPATAKRSLDRFLSREPDHALARVTRARALTTLGKPLAAARDYTRALAALEDGGRPIPSYYLERARALAAAGPKHLDRAIAGLDEGLVRLGNPVTLELYAIELETSQGRYDAALARVERIAAGANRKESWLIRRGEILEAAGRAGKAKQAYRDALQAIEALPASRKGNRAVSQMQAKAQAALQRLSATTTSSVP